LPGADSARRVLASAVAAGLWARPFLLLGRGTERDAAAREFLRAVLCAGRAPGAGAPCGACGPCGRFERGHHADFHLLVPEKGRATVGVDAVDALQRALSLRPVEGRAAGALVPSAERLTPQAQNALLKTLEEPPPRTALVLTASAPRALLPTVRSRCATVRMPPVSAEEVRAAARGRGAAEEAAAILSVAAGGDPVALESAEEEGAAEAAEALSRALAPGAGGDPLAAVEPAIAWVRGRGSPLEMQRERLRMALRVLLDLHLPQGAGGMPGRLRAGYNALPPAARGARLAALGTARERVERNVDPAGILEALAVSARAADRDAPPLK
jgi:DNA polymerase-3 subunit delta'